MDSLDKKRAGNIQQKESLKSMAADIGRHFLLFIF